MRAQGDYDAARAAFIARQPMGRLGTPEEIADLAVYLAGATYTSGQAYAIRRRLDDLRARLEFYSSGQLRRFLRFRCSRTVSTLRSGSRNTPFASPERIIKQALRPQANATGRRIHEICSFWRSRAREAGRHRCARQYPRSVRPCARPRGQRTRPVVAGGAVDSRSRRPAAGFRQSAPRPMRGRHRQVHLHRPELFRPRRRNRCHGAARADHLHEGDLGDRRPE